MLSFIKRILKRDQEPETGRERADGALLRGNRRATRGQGQGPWWDLIGRSSVCPKLVKRCATSSSSSSSSSSRSSALCLWLTFSFGVPSPPRCLESLPSPSAISLLGLPPPSLPPSLLASSPPAHPRCLLLSRLPSVASSSFLSLTFSLPSLCFCCHPLA
jgi:hypothetical protein